MEKNKIEPLFDQAALELLILAKQKELREKG